MYCIIVKTQLHPGTADQFLPVMLENAAASVRDEPGCLVFDVLQDQQSTDTFFLYEIYQSPDALQQHKQTPHYKKSRELITDLIADQSVVRADVIAVNPNR
jgi:(4S)-4-hydroxy-5-phosphonooxypentane-2,3-dione isomerase